MKKCVQRPPGLNNTNSSFFDLSATTIEGEKFEFARLKGKKTLIINTASKCGFTDQYSIIENFHRLYGNQVEVLGFPSNDFQGQEPESEDKIKQFCSDHYDVTFRLFKKISVTGKNKSSVYEWLSDSQKNGWNKQSPTWNFCKYLVNEQGNLMLFTGPRILPTHQAFLKLIDA